MANDGAILNLAVITNVAPLQQGMADCVAGVRAATANMTTDFRAVQGVATAAFKQIRADSLEAAKGLQTDAIAIAVASQQIREAKRNELVIYGQLRKGVVDQSEATALLAVQQSIAREASAAMTQQLRQQAVAQEEVAVTARHAVTDIQATSAGLRAFEGNPGIRAMEVFFSKTLNLGPVFQAMFPVVGALAFADVLIKVGREAWNAAQNILFLKGANEGLDQQAITVSKDIAASADSTESHIEAMLEKTSGHAAALKQKLQYEASKPIDLSSYFYADSVKKMPDDVKANYETLYKSVAPNDVPDRLRGIRTEVQNLQTALTAVKDGTSAFTIPKVSGYGPDEDRDPVSYYETRLKLAKQIQQELEAKGTDRDASLGAMNLDANTAAVQEEQAKQAKAAANQLRQIETQFAQMNTKLPEEALAFWSRFNGTFKEGSTEYLHVIEQVNKYTAEFQKSLKDGSKLSAEMKKNAAEASAAVPESVTRGIEEFNKHLVEQAEDITRTGARWDGYGRSVLKSKEIMAAHNLAMQEMAIKAAEAAHALTPVAAAQQLAALHTGAHAAKLKELVAELERLKAEGANLKPGDKGYEQNQTKQQDAQNAISQEKGSGQQQKVQDSAAIAAAMAKPYLSAFDAINNGWLRVQNDLIAGNHKIGQDVRRMALQWTQDLAKGFEQNIANHLRMEIIQATQHRATAAANTVVDGAAAATSVQISALAAIKKQAHAAANAAGKAYVAFADIPIVGPELGAVAAAATYASVMALAAFEKGGIVAGSPGMAVPILAHSGERVLTTTQTNNFERMVNNSSNSGGNKTLNLRMGDTHNYGGPAQSGGVPTDKTGFVRFVRTLHREGHLDFMHG